MIFSPLAKDDVREIALQQIAKIQAAMARSGRQLTLSASALELLVQDGYSPAFGARFLKRVIEDRIKLPVSQRWTEGTYFAADARDGKIEIEVSTKTGPYALAATA